MDYNLKTEVTYDQTTRITRKCIRCGYSKTDCNETEICIQCIMDDCHLGEHAPGSIKH